MRGRPTEWLFAAKSPFSWHMAGAEMVDGEEDQESQQQCLNIFPPNCKSFHPPDQQSATITNYCAADNIWLTISKQAGVEITAAMLTSGAVLAGVA